MWHRVSYSEAISFWTLSFTLLKSILSLATSMGVQ